VAAVSLEYESMPISQTISNILILHLCAALNSLRTRLLVSDQPWLAHLQFEAACNHAHDRAHAISKLQMGWGQQKLVMLEQGEGRMAPGTWRLARD
jgi:hypothetical protein